jgi:hypothetical protein
MSRALVDAPVAPAPDAAPELDANPAMALGPLRVVTALVLGFLLVAQALAAGRRERS